MAFLHGDLVVTIVSATELPQGESYHLGGLGRKLASLARDYNDPYVNVLIDGEKIITTTALDNAKEPVWNETFTVPMCQKLEKLDFEVKDKDVVGSTPLATGSLAVQDLVQAPGMVLDTRLSLTSVKKKKQQGQLSLRLRFLPCTSVPAIPEVPDIYFKARPGNRVVLYQDAHNEPGFFPAVSLPDNTVYQVRGAWQDIYSAIQEARDFVFLTGWSFHPEIRLVRKPDGLTLGELLLDKAKQGVKVCIMVWDDRTSNVLNAGVMGTHDEAMRTYFKGSAVKCALVGRSGGHHNSILEGQTASTFFSHHQKSVMCDADPLPGSTSRRAVAFIGGLDLTKGRYDTAEHSLFRTYETLHKDDYQNASFDCKGGWAPREPWEDIHCKLDGPAAHQVIRNFTERWAKQGDPDAPLNFALPDPDQGVVEDPAAFSVQVMRSIDARSAVFEAGNNKLFLKKGRAVDRSIQLGYIHQIRRAQDFIFIENQYFLGASFNWTEQADSGCSHPIPAEITQKIVNKIRVGERFAAYIIQPLFPEGPPADGSMQAILRFQKLTAESMYTRIAEEINTRKAQFPDFDAVPTDYLNFYCLGNRETTENWSLPSAPQPAATEACFNSSRSRRFMIYVHSKLMITDDEHAIIGSANVNMRSMAGTRDTEIAAGIWQPLHLCQGPGMTPRGQVHAFRLSLWAEHLCGKHGALEECFRAPSSVECVRRVNELAQANWQKWIGEEVVEMDAHLMCYPIMVDPRTGFVTEREDTNKVVPDFPNAPLFGAQSNIAAGMGLPYTLTT